MGAIWIGRGHFWPHNTGEGAAQFFSKTYLDDHKTPEVKKLAKIICDPYIFFQIFPFNRCQDIRVFVNGHLELMFSTEL